MTRKGKDTVAMKYSQVRHQQHQCLQMQVAMVQIAVQTSHCLVVEDLPHSEEAVAAAYRFLAYHARRHRPPSEDHAMDYDLGDVVNEDGSPHPSLPALLELA